MTLFSRDELGVDIVETVISSLHLEEYQYSQPFNDFVAAQDEGEEHREKVLTFFSNDAMSIEESANRLLSTKIEPEPEILLDWVQIEDKVPFTSHNAYVKTLKKNNSHLIEKTLLTQKCEKKVLYGILIKEPQGSSMSKVDLSHAGVQRLPQLVLRDLQRTGQKDRRRPLPARLPYVFEP